MPNKNKVVLMGNLSRDPELSYTPNGRPVCRFRLATSHSWKDSEGKLQTRKEFHRIVAWGPLAEVCGKHLKKGRGIDVEGRLQTRSFDDREGVRRSITEIVIREMQFLPSSNGALARENEEAEAAASQAESQEAIELSTVTEEELEAAGV